MRSLIDNAGPGAKLHFHIATAGVSETDRAALASVASDGPRPSSVRFTEFRPDPVRHLQRSRLITRTAYARLFLADLLPHDVDRVLYMDCDLVFERDVRELWIQDLENRTLGAVDNRYWEDSARHQARLRLARPSYFNSGVLLVDVNRWRDMEAGRRALAFAEKTGDRLILHDQDALNGALHDEWAELPLHWNVWVVHPDLHADARALFHFMGAPKPWHADFDRRFGDKFFDYLDRTPYAGRRPFNPAGLGKLGRRLRRRLPFLPSAVRIARARLSPRSS